MWQCSMVPMLEWIHHIPFRNLPGYHLSQEGKDKHFSLPSLSVLAPPTISYGHWYGPSKSSVWSWDSLLPTEWKASLLTRLCVISPHWVPAWFHCTLSFVCQQNKSHILFSNVHPMLCVPTAGNTHCWHVVNKWMSKWMHVLISSCTVPVSLCLLNAASSPPVLALLPS